MYMQAHVCLYMYYRYVHIQKALIIIKNKDSYSLPRDGVNKLSFNLIHFPYHILDILIASFYFSRLNTYRHGTIPPLPRVGCELGFGHIG